MSEQLQSSKSNSDSNNLSMLTWLSAVFTGWIGPLIFFLVKKDDEQVQAAAKESLNWGINMLFVYIVCMVLNATIILALIGLPLLAIASIAHLVFTIIGTIKASKGEQYRIPLPILRLIK